LGGDLPVVEGLCIPDSQQQSTSTQVTNPISPEPSPPTQATNSISTEPSPPTQATNPISTEPSPPTSTNATTTRVDEKAPESYINGVPSVALNSKRSNKRKLYLGRDCNESYEQKRSLQNDLMKIKIYKHKLEILKLERELNLPESEFTSEFNNTSE